MNMMTGSEGFENGPRFRVRQRELAPGAALPEAVHLHKRLHWVVVSGAARVVLDGQARTVYETGAIDIPVGAVHRLENCGRVPLHLVEVQTGCYLGDDVLLGGEMPFVTIR